MTTQSEILFDLYLEESGFPRPASAKFCVSSPNPIVWGFRVVLFVGAKEWNGSTFVSPRLSAYVTTEDLAKEVAKSWSDYALRASLDRVKKIAVYNRTPKILKSSGPNSGSYYLEEVFSISPQERSVEA